VQALILTGTHLRRKARTQTTWQVLQANSALSDNKKRKLILQVFWEFIFIHIPFWALDGNPSLIKNCSQSPSSVGAELGCAGLHQAVHPTVHCDAHPPISMSLMILTSGTSVEQPFQDRSWIPT